MTPVYQTIIDPGKGNCQQAAIASLFDLELHQVPDFKKADSFWTSCINFVIDQGKTFHCFLYNNRIQSLEGYEYNLDIDSNKHYFNEDTYNHIQESNGVNGYFCAGVYSPKYFNSFEARQITHAVIIDKNFNIVHDPNPNNKGIEKYPLHWLIGYNGIIDIMLID